MPDINDTVRLNIRKVRLAWQTPTPGEIAMNTRISYLYRDAGNYKAYHDLVICGKLTLAQVALYLDSGEFFIPSQVGLPDLQAELGTPTDDDHVWHHLPSDAFTPTETSPTVRLTARTLLTRFRRAHTAGWDVSAAMARNGLELSACDWEQLLDFFVRAGYSRAFSLKRKSLPPCPFFPLQMPITPQT